MTYEELEKQIIEELCDVLDAPEIYEDCVLAIHKTTLKVSVASPSTFTKEFETFPLSDMFQVCEDSQELELDMDTVAEVVSRFAE